MHKIKIDGIKIAISEVSTERLEQAYGDLLEEMAQIKTQLDYAKSEAQDTGVYREKEWFNNARCALRFKGREHQLITREIAERKRIKRQAKGDSVERHFLDIAKRKLEFAVFQDILTEAIESTQS